MEIKCPPCGQQQPLEQLKDFTVLIVDRVITCTDDGVLFDATRRVAVVVSRATKLIVDIFYSDSLRLQDYKGEIVELPPGSTLMPGFIDCHVHLTISQDDYQIDHLRQSSADKSLKALKAAQGLLFAGLNKSIFDLVHCFNAAF